MCQLFSIRASIFQASGPPNIDALLVCSSAHQTMNASVCTLSIKQTTKIVFAGINEKLRDHQMMAYFLSVQLTFRLKKSVVWWEKSPLTGHKLDSSLLQT